MRRFFLSIRASHRSYRRNVVQVVVVVVALAISIGSSPAAADTPPRGVGAAFAVGVTRSSVRSTVESDYGARHAMAFGLRINWQLTQTFAFTWGVQVAQFGFSGGPSGLLAEPDAISQDPCTDGGGADCEGDVDTALNMLSLQVLVPRYQFRTVPIYLAVGIEVNFLMGARSRSAMSDEVVDSTRNFRFRGPSISQRLVAGYRFARLFSVELALHQPLMSWGSNIGLGAKFADGTATILSLVLGSR